MTPGPMAAHVAACVDGVLPTLVDNGAPLRGHEVVFARRDMHVNDAAARLIASAGDCHDLPQVGFRLARGDPLCSVSAQADDAATLCTRLKARRDALLDILETTTS
jgi:predicted ATP-grasp superfamily ATP-dependent carboligase